MTDWNVTIAGATRPVVRPEWARLGARFSADGNGQDTAARSQAPSKTPTIGQVIKTRRQQLGLTQEELADRVCALGSSLRQSDVSRMEHGKVILPRYKRMTCLAAALELPLGALLDHAGWDGAAALPWDGTAGDVDDGDSATAERVAVTTTPSSGAADRDPDDIIAWARASVAEAEALLRQYHGGSV